MSKIIHEDIIDKNVIKRLHEMELAAKKAKKAMDDLAESIKNIKQDYPDFFDQI